MSNEPDNRPRVRLMFVGICDVTMKSEKPNGKSKSVPFGGQLWLPLPAENGIGDAAVSEAAADISKDLRSDKLRVYTVKAMPRGARPGSIYEFIEPEPGKIITNNPRYLRTHIGEQSDYWQARFDAMRAEQSAKKQEDSALLRNLNLEALRPMRLAYMRANPAQKAAILIKAIQYIQKV